MLSGHIVLKSDYIILASDYFFFLKLIRSPLQNHFLNYSIYILPRGPRFEICYRRNKNLSHKDSLFLYVSFSKNSKNKKDILESDVQECTKSLVCPGKQASIILTLQYTLATFLISFSSHLITAIESFILLQGRLCSCIIIICCNRWCLSFPM